ncbi:MAG TPA: energy transducer TonB [Acidobacteriaceae bacterium]|nr:energy transducer TonB [Acidobacteriaceae bacterium]
MKLLVCAFFLTYSAAVVAQPPTNTAAGTARPDPQLAAEEAQYGPLAKIGHGVTAPVVTRQSEPEYTPEARKKKFNGTLLIGLVVDKQGRPQDVHIIRGVGMGLDENALKAVGHYRFRPAMENGQPVAVRINVEVNFQIFDNPDEAAATVRKAKQRKGAPSPDESEQPVPDPDDPVHGYK